MFVSCHPTVPKNGPDPSQSLFIIYQKSPEKHVFFYNFQTFLLVTKFAPILPTKSLWRKKILKKADLPTLTFLSILPTLTFLSM